MTARERIIEIIGNSSLVDYSQEFLHANDIPDLADAILAVVPELVENCLECNGFGSIPMDEGCYENCSDCNGTGIRIKQEQREGEDGDRKRKEAPVSEVERLAKVCNEKGLFTADDLRLAYLAGISDKEQNNDYWCEQGSWERIEELIEDGELKPCTAHGYVHRDRVRVDPVELFSVVASVCSHFEVHPTEFDNAIAAAKDEIITFKEPSDD